MFRTSALLVALLAASPALAQAPDTAPLIERLRQADTDSDGRITRAELIAWRAQQFARLDRNGDGFIDQNDVPALLAARMGPRVKQLEASFDTDHDGRISRAEFIQGPTPGFDLADADHDGVVTRAELDAALARAQARRRP